MGQQNDSGAIRTRTWVYPTSFAFPFAFLMLASCAGSLGSDNAGTVVAETTGAGANSSVDSPATRGIGNAAAGRAGNAGGTQGSTQAAAQSARPNPTGAAGGTATSMSGAAGSTASPAGANGAAGGDAMGSSAGATSAGGAMSAPGDTGSAPTPPTGGPAAPSGAASGGLFEAQNPWNTAVDGSAKSGASDTIVNALAQAGGWGTGGFQIDFSITLLHDKGDAPMQSFTPTGDFFSPDCDAVPFPVPAGGMLEGETGYTCSTDGDCHLLVVQDASKKLYEMWRANIGGGVFQGGCVAVWDLTRAYPQNLRGDGCTSADAGGFPVAAMIFSADEVVAGAINHALRFILPNNRIRRNMYVAPGTHTTSATRGGPDLPPYGVRMRLRADYPLASLPTDGARVVARALQKYGMFLADGGKVPLTAESDQVTQHTWAEAGVNADSLGVITPTDFEVVEMGTPIDGSSLDCKRNP